MKSSIAGEIRSLFRYGMGFILFLDGKKYANAEVLYKDEDELSITLSLTNDSRQSSTDTFVFVTEGERPGWRWCNPNNFFGSGLGGPEYFVTEQVFELTPVL